MAINFGSSNLSSVDYNLHNIEKFNGVDYTTTPTLVDESRAIDISNYLPKGNSLVKRNGIEMVSTIVDNGKYIIHNIWESPDKTKNRDYYIVFATEKNEKGYINPVIMQVSELLNIDETYVHIKRRFETYDYENSPALDLKDLYSYGVYFEKKLFILCMGEYLFVSKGTVGLDINKVKDYAFVPTIVTNLADDRLNFKTTQLQQFNLLTNKCYIEISTVIGSIETNEVFEVGRYFNENQTLKLISIDNQAVDSTQMLEIEKIGTFSYNSTQRVVVLLDKHVQSETDKGKLYTFKLEFEYSQLENKTPNVVEKMRFGIPYGSYGHTDRLFLSGNQDYPNLDIHSCETNDLENPWKDYTYFGDNSYSFIGNDNSAITSYGFLNNGYMAIFKESKLGQPNLFLRTYQMIENEQGYLEERFPINISGISVDNNVKSEVISYENDLLINCPKGVYKIIAGESTATQTYNSTEMSYFIRDNLGKNIDNSVSIVFDNKLFVSREDETGKKRIYVADYKRYGFIDGKQVYEWFILDDIDVIRFFILNDELYFSNEKGLFKFNETFEDHWFLKTEKANINGEEFSEEVFVNEAADRIILTEKNEAIQNILNSENIEEKWKTFKNKTKIKIGDNFLIEASKDIPMYLDENGEYVRGIRFDENIKRHIFEIKYSGEEKNQFIVPVILMNILSNLNNLETYEKMDINPSIIYDEKCYWVDKVEFGDDRYYIYAVENSEWAGSFDGWDDGWITMMLNSFHQHFEFDIEEMYCTVKEQQETMKYPFSKCTLIGDYWYYNETKDKLTFIGNKNTVVFNEFSLKLYDFSIDFFSLYGYIRDVVLKFSQNIKCYWKSKFMSLGRLDFLKTIDRFTFVADSKRGGDTNVGFRTINKSVLTPTSVEYKNFNFNDIDFSYFSFSTNDFAKTQTVKKKIKNFSFVQMVFENNDDKDSTVTSTSFRYKYTKNNKGVK